MKRKKNFYIGASFLILFVIWTIAVKYIDVKAIGPNATSVGFATVNGFVHKLTGVHMNLYIITDRLSLIPIAFAIGFGATGLIQWIRRKKLFRVDYDILILGCFYIAVMAAYILFEIVEVNYRPLLINGIVEVSYPSSTTMLVMCIMPTAVMQLKRRIKGERLRILSVLLIEGYTAFMVIGRFISGVHWFSDIVGGALISSGLVMLYRAFISLKHE